MGRVLDAEPVLDLAAFTGGGGGRGLKAALRLGPVGAIEEVEAAGLRGRGGAGFPTGRKWRTVAESSSASLPSTVVVNATEGEPGSFKDRMLLRRNPYRVLEGALAAASTVGADGVIFALKASFHAELGRLRAAIDEIKAAGWLDGIELYVVEGPSEYLYGEETALLEVVNGRAPFPRIAPPYRHGVDDSGEDPVSAADVTMAAPGEVTPTPPTLVNNVETLTHVPGILAEGAEWYRSLGTPDSPGTVVCTVTGWTRRHGVGEFPMGTPLAVVIDALGGGPAGERVTAVVSGVAHPFLPGDRLDTPVSYEGMEAAGSGLGAAGFIVFDDTVDLVAAAQGVSRFLAVESCGQCTPCKQDGLAIAELLDAFRRSEATEDDLSDLAGRVETVADEARCFLAHHQQRVVGSLLRLFPEELRRHAVDLGGHPRAPVDLGEHPRAPVDLGGHPRAPGDEAGAPEPVPIVPILDLKGGRAVLDMRQAEKQPDWTYDETDSGQSPADRIDQRLDEELEPTPTHR